MERNPESDMNPADSAADHAASATAGTAEDNAEKKTYYVSVQAGTAVDNIGAAPFEFVIEATPKEIARLQALFEEKEDAENDTLIRGMVPAIPYHQDPENDAADESLKRVYAYIHELGTEETRRHIESMGVLDKVTPDDTVNAFEPAPE